MKVLSVTVCVIVLLGVVQSDTEDATLQEFYSYQQVLLLKMLHNEVLGITTNQTTSCDCNSSSKTPVMDLSSKLKGLREEYAVSSCSDLYYSNPSRYYYITTKYTPPMYMYCEIDRAFDHGYYGNWLRVVDLDMRKPIPTCPSSFQTVTLEDDKHLCKRQDQGCTSHFFPTYGYEYSVVCGKAIAYQKGKPDAFFPSAASDKTIDDVYVDGVSITHGSKPRKHIWTFAAAMHESNDVLLHLCPCTNRNNVQKDNIYIPEFVGENYFCDTGASSRADADVFYGNNPMWEGAGCGVHNECCFRQNSQAYFCTTLDVNTTDPIEVRLCGDQQDEDIYLQQLQLFVQ